MRIRVQDLLDSLQPQVTIDLVQWNELEHDRADPNTLGDEGFVAIARALDLNADELRALASRHLQARREERRLWALLAEDAHAFRRRRSTP